MDIKFIDNHLSVTHLLALFDKVIVHDNKPDMFLKSNTSLSIILTF